MNIREEMKTEEMKTETYKVLRGTHCIREWSLLGGYE